jgi:hypothetical protein
MLSQGRSISVERELEAEYGDGYSATAEGFAIQNTPHPDEQRLMVYTPKSSWYTVGWIFETRKLGIVDSSLRRQNEKLRLAEKTLFEEHNPAGAIEPIQCLLDDQCAPLNKQPDDLKHYVEYLLGLAYEQKGDDAKAVQAYWQLWHDYPQSPFAYVAQRKLKSASP